MIYELIQNVIQQTCRNNLLEKRQRKFDAELHSAQEELKRERAAKERLSRERDQAHAEKYALEQSLSVSYGIYMEYNSQLVITRVSIAVILLVISDRHI